MFQRDPFRDPGPLIARVYAYVAYRIGDGPDAEDVTSDVFERALRYRHSYDRRLGEPLSWLIGIARRRLATSGGPVILSLDVDSYEIEDVDMAALAVDRLDLLAAVEQLSMRDRELIALRYGAEMTARQIAELLGERTNAVEVGLHRAIKRLRHVFEPAERPAVA